MYGLWITPPLFLDGVFQFEVSLFRSHGEKARGKMTTEKIEREREKNEEHYHFTLLLSFLRMNVQLSRCSKQNPGIPVEKVARHRKRSNRKKTINIETIFFAKIRHRSEDLNQGKYTVSIPMHTHTHAHTSTYCIRTYMSIHYRRCRNGTTYDQLIEQACKKRAGNEEG